MPRQPTMGDRMRALPTEVVARVMLYLYPTIYWGTVLKEATSSKRELRHLRRCAKQLGSSMGLYETFGW